MTQPPARPDVEHYERVAEQYAGWGVPIQMSSPFMLTLFAYLRHLEADLAAADAKVAAARNKGMNLSTAMREARKQSKEGNETWIVVSDLNGEYKLLRCLGSTMGWETYYLHRKRWQPYGPVGTNEVEDDLCRLVTRNEGEAILTPEAS